MTANKAVNASATTPTRVVLLSTRSVNSARASAIVTRRRRQIGTGPSGAAVSDTGALSPRRGRAGGAGIGRTLVLRGGGRLGEAEGLELAADLVLPRRAVRDLGEARQLLHPERLHIEVPLHSGLQPVGPVEMLPFGAQRRDRVALALDLALELH